MFNECLETTGSKTYISGIGSAQINKLTRLKKLRNRPFRTGIHDLHRPYNI